MNEIALIHEWLKYKEAMFLAAAGHFYRLETAISIDHTYRAARQGHPSTFAGVRFFCRPADELDFVSAATWPADLPSDYVGDLERAIGNGLVEELLSRSASAYRGCSVVLEQVSWDDVGSSEMAFYRAAREAMQELIARGRWEYVSR